MAMRRTSDVVPEVRLDDVVDGVMRGTPDLGGGRIRAWYALAWVGMGPRSVGRTR